MVYYCAWGTCKSDTRFPDKQTGKNIVFHTFPNWKEKGLSPAAKQALRVRCRAWIHACGRPKHQLNIKNLGSKQRVCSLHFIDGAPTDEHPNPVRAPTLESPEYSKSKEQAETTPVTTRSGRSAKAICVTQTRKKRKLDAVSCTHEVQDSGPHSSPKATSSTVVGSSSEVLEDTSLLYGPANLDGSPSTFGTESTTEITEWLLELENLRNEKLDWENARAQWTADKSLLEEQRDSLLRENELLMYQNNQLTDQLTRLRNEQAATQQKLSAVRRHLNWSPEKLQGSPIKHLFNLMTGFSEQRFLSLYQFFMPSEFLKPFSYLETRRANNLMPKLTQFLLVMIKLRNGLENGILAFAFGVTSQEVSVIFRSWINYMSLRLAEVPMWPPREVILKHTSASYREEFPTTLVLLDATELRIEKPSSLVRQSQCYSEYKGTNTLKCLVACSPNGSLLWVSKAFTGSMSDKEIVVKSGFLEALKLNLKHGLLEEGDGIMVDKGFDIEPLLGALNLNLNIPPFASKSAQMSASDVDLTRKIARHRIHVERLIGRIRTFKIIDRKIRISNMTTLNQTWLVCAMLTRFMPFIVS